MTDKSLKLIDRTKFRLIYSFFISDKISSFNDHISYIIALICLRKCLEFNNMFDEIIFIIQSTNKDNPLIIELKNKLIEYTLENKNVSFIIEENNPYSREGGIFEKYIIDKLDEYDGLTLFFHNKGLNDVYGYDLNSWCSYWVIGEYYYLMFHIKDFFGGFLRNDKLLIHGWPYMCDNYHEQWLIGGNCFWMKCKEIKKYINEHNLQTNYITSKCISEFYFPEILDKELIDYPNSNIIKNYSYQAYYEPALNDKFNNYLQNITPYNDYVNFIYFYNEIIDEYNKHIEMITN